MSAGDKYFQGNPVRLDVSRSRFPLHHNWRGTFNAGRWVPFYTQEVLAGDTFKIDANVLVRSSTPVAPVMDDAVISVEFFFVPFDLILSRSYMSPSTTDSVHSWRAFFGAQDSLLNMPSPASGIKLPQMKMYYDNYVVGGLADCLGIPRPAANSGYQVNALKALAYYAIYNEFLRDPNVMAPVTYSITGGQLNFTQNADAGIPAAGNILSYFPLVPACANHGYFGSALPWPQRNTTSVTLPLGEVAPIVDGSGNTGGLQDPYNVFFNNGTTLQYGYTDTPKIKQNTSGGSMAAELMDANGLKTFGLSSQDGNPLFSADLSAATSASINTIRFAFATQRWYEQLARSGNRYDEMIQGMFGVTPPSKGIKPEYLGGRDIPVNVQQVNGTADANIGATGATSNTFDAGHYCTKSFTEPGLIIGVMCVRTHDSFAQGLDPFDAKSDRFDFYWPQFANIGETPIPKRSLLVKGSSGNVFSTDDESVFGYQEYAAEYRFHPDVVTGHFRPQVGSGLANWTYVNYFSDHPTLKSFLVGGDRFKTNVDRTLKVSAATAGYQFFSMVHMNVVAVRPMPLYSIPGLLDHH